MTLPITYEERILLYVDNLGWSDLVGESESEPVPAKKIIVERAIDHLISFHAGVRIQRNTEWQVALASDSLISSIPEPPPSEDSHLHELLYETARLAHHLLLEGVFVRGALVLGKVLHHKELIVGPGVGKAVNLERKKAITPRILVDERVRPLLRSDDNTEDFIYKGPHDNEDSFDYLGYIHHQWQQSGCVESGIDPDISLLLQVLARKTEQDAKHPDPKEKEKLKKKNDWVSDYLANYHQASQHLRAR